MTARKWIFAPALVALALGTAGINHTVSAQPTQPAKAAKAAKAGRTAKAKRTVTMTPMMLERIVGTPLTDEQKAAIEEAAQAYQASIAKAVGLTADELDAKAKEYRKAQRNKKAAE